ncbi:MAG TPA: helix-turn-helix transcriptional regulator [Solirubrobacteraceae bacterium]|nr:helix-turn-helix transcriptional regulator [Solirubrobacteraceae bacterium]
MTLRFALLATLSSRPRTGYDLLRIFDSSVGFVWHAAHTQIYPELRRMEAEGLLESVEVPRGPKAHKREYQITQRGLEMLRTLASTPVEPSPEKDPYRLKAAYLEWADPEGARQQFQLHLDHYQRWLKEWEQMAQSIEQGTDPVVGERLKSRPETEHRTIVAAKVFAYQGMIARAKMEIEWARNGLRLLDELQNAS